MINDVSRAQIAIWDKLSNISVSKKIGSAYLFTGPIGSGKETLALKFSQLINCENSLKEICYECSSCIKFRALQHERLNIVVPLPTPKSASSDGIFPKEYFESIIAKSEDPFYKIAIPKANRILIQSIRDLKKKLYFKYEKDSGRNIVVIFDCELLCSGQGESGNALLKLLEEPPDRTTIILVTDHKKMLFETIISRCQNIEIPTLSNEYVYNWLIENNSSNSEAEFLVMICRANIHRARTLSRQPVEKLINQIEKLATTVVSKDSEKWRNFISHYSRLFGTNHLDFNHHLNLITIWMHGANKLKQGLSSGYENTGLQPRMISFNKKFPKANIFEVILCIEDVKKHSRQNLYMPLILLNMLIDIQKFVYE